MMCNVSVSFCNIYAFQTLIHWYTVCADDTVNQVIAGLLPTLKEIQGNINSVRNDLSSFNVIVNNLTEKVSSLEEHQTSKMDQLESKLEKSFEAVKSQLEEHITQTTSKLAGLQNTFNVSLTSHTEQLNVSMREELGCIKEDLSSLNEIMNRINSHMEEHDNHVTTMINECLQCNATQPPSNDSLHTCGGTGSWRRVVYLDMTDPNTTCPSGWQLTSHSKRTCGKVSNGGLTCDSVTFPVSGGDYTRVCGTIKGYQYKVTDAFQAYHEGDVTTIDGAYLCGVSLTHGSPRQHIWTFAAGRSEYHNEDDSCPCDVTIDISIPPFVGGDYFCESGRNSGPITEFYPDDPLWDGDGCASSTCCSFNNPPYFTKQLPSPTTDDIEARLCRQDSNGDTPIEFIELYVQ